MTILTRLEQWHERGVTSSEQHTFLVGLSRREPFSTSHGRGRSPFSGIFRRFNRKKCDLVGSFCNRRRRGAVFPMRRRARKALVYEIFGCQLRMTGAVTRVDENWGGRQPVVDNSGMRSFTLSNFQRPMSHGRRHLTMRTIGFGTAPRILFSRQRSPRKGVASPKLLESPPSYNARGLGLRYGSV